jgi:hypothetical protein
MKRSALPKKRRRRRRSKQRALSEIKNDKAVNVDDKRRDFSKEPSNKQLLQEKQRRP